MFTPGVGESSDRKRPVFVIARFWLSALFSTHSATTINNVVIPSDQRESRDLRAEYLLQSIDNA